ncbi:MAG: hypothetical protein A2020_14680 [Lentisphaerae bacterium GWF2_45_14]|nr:MAG: hypothetical protein A2020_14680 [Lentisphaerae bacterium GWF2_45_14]
MIKLSENSVLIINPDGSRFNFESEELQSRIIKSCLSAGIRDLWIAEDIVLALEYALNSSAGNKKEFALSEVNSLVIKILQMTGYPSVAEKFSTENVSSELEISPEKGIVAELLKKHLGLEGETLESISRIVTADLEKLKINKAPPLFFVELAKVELKRLSSWEVPEAIVELKNLAKSVRISKDAVMSALTEKTKMLITEEVLTLHGISGIFPSLKIDFRIVKFLEGANLRLPLTELSVLPRFHELAAPLNEIYTAANGLVQKANSGQAQSIEKQLPVYFTVQDMSEFSLNFIQSPWPQSKKSNLEMMSFLEEQLDFSFFKIRLK